MIEQIKRFNRTLAPVIGALNGEFLGSTTPLGEAQLLREIGAGDADLESIAPRLNLDTNSVEALLEALKANGWVAVEENEANTGARTARLTPSGIAQWDLQNRYSDAAALDILAPLDPTQRQQLTKAMTEVSRLVIASAIRVRVCDPRHQDADACLDAYFRELARRYGSFDPNRSRALPAEQMTLPAGMLLVAYMRGQPVGCGALKFLPDNVAAIKRVWVSQEVRGFGLGRRLMTELEKKARLHGVKLVRLETKSELFEAISMYIGMGYHEVEAFNDEFYADHWFEKSLRAD
jgi:ribosomal protein S18 acetylase RimI-like enzyme